MKTGAVIFLLFGCCHLSAFSQNNLQTRVVATNLDTPWEILWGPDNFIWATERFGRISRINPQTGEVSEVITIAEVNERGEGGLLGMVPDPDFNTNNYFYVAYNYSAPGNDYREKIVRFTFNSATGKADNPFTLIENIDGANNHNGCRMVISPDKKLIFTTGDAQITSTSQNLSSLNGKTLRINLDGSIPDDNPIANSYVWSWGHRNAQGLVYSPNGEILYSSEHGPSNDDEINIISKGRNYGWPNVEGFCDNFEMNFCNDSNVVEPIFAWTPTLAVAGIDFYHSDLIPEWKNSLLVTSLKSRRITQLRLNENGTEVTEAKDFFVGAFGRLRDICISPEGKVYIAVSNRDGRGSPTAKDDRIIEIAPTSTNIEENSGTDLISVYPNPAEDFIYVNLNSQQAKPAKYSLINISGQIIKKGVLENGESKIFFPHGFSGTAFLQVEINDQKLTKKIVVGK
jgi:glucose/arabinose dehydrogenase